jgi:hypothetical protein
VIQVPLAQESAEPVDVFKSILLVEDSHPGISMVVVSTVLFHEIEPVLACDIELSRLIVSSNVLLP